ncbi:MAG: hypothetical protein WCT03_04210 [Candidatus Obscuribacterales bacterium]
MGETSERPAIASEAQSDKPDGNVTTRKSRAIVTALVTTTIFCTALVIWLSFDKHIPACDEANHVMNGLTYTNLLQHARPLRAAWWHNFFTVNTYYPPVGTLTMGIACAFIKDTIFALQLVKIFWLALLSLSVGAIAFMVSGSSIAVAVAVCLVNLCILTCDLSHSSLLDMPLIAMVGAALATIYWKDGSASLKRSLITGIVLGIAIMTKQVAIAFLGFPILLDSVKTLKQHWNKKGIYSVMLVALPALLLCLPWTIQNYGSVQKLNAEIAADLSMRGSTISRILFNLEYYLGSWFYCASPLVLTSALLGLVSLTKEQHKKLIPLWFSVLPAALALSLISCQPARDRYVAPIVVLIAIAGGFGLAQLAKRNKAAFVVISAIFMPMAALQYVSFNLSPYPIAEPRWVTDTARLLQCSLREHISPFFDKSNSISRIAKITPSQHGGEIANKILDCIEHEDGKTSSWLNITAFSADLDVHEFELLAKLRKLSVMPTTSRLWTALGDKEEFSQSKALNYRWYVIKDGDQGFRFADEKSASAHTALIEFVKRNCLLVKNFKISGSDSMQLYRAK